MPENATDVAVLRIVVREGFTLDLADSLINHLQEACDDLQTNPPLMSASKKGFAH
jgi:glutamate decarboxylase